MSNFQFLSPEFRTLQEPAAGGTATGVARSWRRLLAAHA